MNNIIKDVAQKYRINPKALKKYIKANGVKPKEATRIQLLEILYENSFELFYTIKENNKKAVEYFDAELIIELCKEYSYLTKKKNMVSLFGGTK